MFSRLDAQDKFANVSCIITSEKVVERVSFKGFCGFERQNPLGKLWRDVF